MNDLHKVCSAMETEWHRTLGCCGNYYEGGYLTEYLLSLFTYKRFCDICEYQISLGINELGLDNNEIDNVIEEICDYSYPSAARWEYVISATNKVSALKNAIDVINYRNFKKIPYGTNIIPDFISRMKDENWSNDVLSAWLLLISEIQLSPSEISDHEWWRISQWLRSKCK